MRSCSSRRRSRRATGARPLWRELVGDELRRERQARGERLKDVAERAGVSTQYLSEVERGLKDPSSEMLQAIAGALDLSVRGSRSAPRGPPALAASPPEALSVAGACSTAAPRRRCRSRRRRRPGSTRSRSVSCADLLGRAAGVPGEHLLQQEPHAGDLVGLEDEVGDGAAALGRRLVQHDPPVRQDRAAARRPAGEQHRGGPRRLPDAGGLDRGLTNCIASYTASIAEIEPPGELM